jgi:copper chaperone CopZ
MAEVVFEVEQAGCESCAARVRGALEPFAEVREVAMDEDADSATVRASGAGLSEDAVNAALEAASHGSGHAYRVRPGSWRGEG